MTADAGAGAPIDPSASANQGRKPVLPKRFYTAVDTKPEGQGFALLLDGRRARTPARNPLVVPTQALADALAREWAAVESLIDPRLMPFTRVANSVIDGVSQNRAEVLAEIVRYMGSDLVVYRADGPADLVKAQRAAWDPLVDWSREAWGAPLVLTEGVVFVAQPESSLDRLKSAAATLIGEGPASAFRLAALHVITALTGSALLALAVGAGRLRAEAAWAAAHVDEDHQIAHWGEDEEAAARRTARRVDMETAAALLAFTAPSS